jgi:hypothetical protein
VVVTIPLRAYPGVPAGPLADKPVIDTCNYCPQRDGDIAELDSGSLTSSELIQRHLAAAQVVKAFNNIFYQHLFSLARPSGGADRSFLPIAGDDARAKDTVIAFLDSIGYGAVDAGPLAESWRQQPGTPVYGAPYGSFSDPAGTPADQATVRQAVAAASPVARPADSSPRRPPGCWLAGPAVDAGPHPGPGRPEVRRAVHHPGDLVPAAPPWTCQMGARRAIERDHGAVEVGLGSPVRHRRATAAARHRHGFMR